MSRNALALSLTLGARRHEIMMEGDTWGLEMVQVEGYIQALSAGA